MSDAAISGMVVGVVAIVCFALSAVIIGVLAISRGHWFSGKASNESLELSSGPGPKSTPPA